MVGDASAGFLRDGRDENGVALPAGIYLYGLVTPRGEWSGRSVRIR